MKGKVENLSAPEWWSRHRALYNVRLGIAGLLIFSAYATKMSSVDGMTVFTTIYLIVSVLLTIGIANLLYFLAPVTEQLLKPRNVAIYRNLTYHISFWCFVIILFISPLLVGYVIDLGSRPSI